MVGKKRKTFYFTKGRTASHGSLDYIFRYCVTIDEAHKILRDFMKDLVEDILQQTLLPRRLLM
jgi:hypothetical protein